MELKIFDVEHGACALLTTDVGTRMMIDCGHNVGTGWTPGKYLQAQGVQKLDLLCITNYDEDHASGFIDLESRVHVDWMARNTSVTGQQLLTLKSDTGVGNNIARLAARFSAFGPSGNPQPHFPNASYQTFCNPFPSFDDENNLSMAVLLAIQGTRFLFPGDLERAGWLSLIGRSPAFRSALTSVDVLLASHHGRESGICSEIFDTYGCRPAMVVISDDYHQYDTQKTTSYYASKCRGGTFRGNARKVLTTRSDGTITFGNFTPTGCGVW